MSDFIFDTGKGQCGLVAFQHNLVKVCLEDKVFMDENWESINPNDFADVDVRYFLHTMKKLKTANMDVNYSNLKFYIEKTVEGFDKTVYLEVLEEINKKELEVAEIEKIKQTYMYFGLYVSMITMANNISDWAKGGFKFGHQIINQFNKMNQAFENANKTYNRLLTVLEDADRSHKTDNSW